MSKMEYFPLNYVISYKVVSSSLWWGGGMWKGYKQTDKGRMKGGGRRGATRQEKIGGKIEGDQWSEEVWQGSEVDADQPEVGSTCL